MHDSRSFLVQQQCNHRYILHVAHGFSSQYSLKPTPQTLSQTTQAPAKVLEPQDMSSGPARCQSYGLIACSYGSWLGCESNIVKGSQEVVECVPVALLLLPKCPYSSRGAEGGGCCMQPTSCQAAMTPAARCVITLRHGLYLHKLYCLHATAEHMHKPHCVHAVAERTASIVVLTARDIIPVPGSGICDQWHMRS